MPLFRWAANYFSCDADEASHHINYVATLSGTESLRGTVRWMQATFYIHFNLHSRIIKMQLIDLDDVSDRCCEPRLPKDLVVVDPLTIYCVVEFIKMFNKPVWDRVPVDVQARFPSNITRKDLGEREYSHRNTMQNIHSGYAPLMFACLKRCPEVVPAKNGRTDAIIRARYGDIDLGSIKWKDGRDTLTYNGTSFSVWYRRHFRLMRQKVTDYHYALRWHGADTDSEGGENGKDSDDDNTDVDETDGGEDDSASDADSSASDADSIGDSGANTQNDGSSADTAAATVAASATSTADVCSATILGVGADA